VSLTDGRECEPVPLRTPGASGAKCLQTVESRARGGGGELANHLTALDINEEEIERQSIPLREKHRALPIRTQRRGQLHAGAAPYLWAIGATRRAIHAKHAAPKVDMQGVEIQACGIAHAILQAPMFLVRLQRFLDDRIAEPVAEIGPERMSVLIGRQLPRRL